MNKLEKLTKGDSLFRLKNIPAIGTTPFGDVDPDAKLERCAKNLVMRRPDEGDSVKEVKQNLDKDLFYYNDNDNYPDIECREMEVIGLRSDGNIFQIDIRDLKERTTFTFSTELNCTRDYEYGGYIEPLENLEKHLGRTIVQSAGTADKS